MLYQIKCSDGCGEIIGESSIPDTGGHRCETCHNKYELEFQKKAKEETKEQKLDRLTKEVEGLIDVLKMNQAIKDADSFINK